MALQGLRKWASGMAEHVPSFNDLNAFPEGHEELGHKELDREANLSETSQASTTTSGSRRLSNKQDDDWPHMDHVVDYHKIEVADHTRDKRRLMDIPKEHNQGSIWEHIVKSEEYMKGKLDPDTGKRLAREHGGGAEPAGPEAYTKPSPPLGLNPRAVLPGDDAKTAPVMVAERAEQKKGTTPTTEPPATQIHSSKEDLVREVFEHYGSE